MDQNQRTNIKKTAAKLFLKYGLRSVSIDDICNELRISKKTFYAHFSQKEALIESVLMEHNEKELKKQDFKPGPCECTGNAIDYLMQASAFHSSNKNDRFVNFFYDLQKYYPEIHKRMSQHNQGHIREKVRENILLGIEENLFRSNFDLELMVRFITVQFVTMTSITSKDLSKASMRKGMELVMDVYIRALCNRAGLDYYEQLLEKQSQEVQVDEEPMKDEDIDRMIDMIIDHPDEVRQIVKNQEIIK